MPQLVVSRAQCLASVIASPELLVAGARTPERMEVIKKTLSAFVCRFAEEAGAAVNQRAVVGA